MENYDIEKKIGKGQFSVVYRARCIAAVDDGEETPIVALKKVQIFEMMDAKARLDCMKEIQLLQVDLEFFLRNQKLNLLITAERDSNNTLIFLSIFLVLAIEPSQCDQVPGFIY